MACNAEINHLPQDVVDRSNAQLAPAPTPDAKGRKLAQGAIEQRGHGESVALARDTRRHAPVTLMESTTDHTRLVRT